MEKSAKPNEDSFGRRNGHGLGMVRLAPSSVFLEAVHQNSGNMTCPDAVRSALLGLGRALGETMAVTMVIGNNTVESSGSLLKPGATLASVIANEFAEAVSELHVQALVEIGFILFVLTLLLNILARLLVWQVARKTPQEVRA